jgi:hypothetical protein
MPFNTCRGAAIALLMGASLAGGAHIANVAKAAPAPKGVPAARTGCDAIGRTFRDGENFTVSSGLDGATIVHVCTHGAWRQYDGSLWQSLHHR